MVRKRKIRRRVKIRPNRVGPQLVSRLQGVRPIRIRIEMQQHPICAIHRPPLNIGNFGGCRYSRHSEGKHNQQSSCTKNACERPKAAASAPTYRSAHTQSVLCVIILSRPLYDVTIGQLFQCSLHIEIAAGQGCFASSS
jgi:hypothetical protein